MRLRTKIRLFIRRWFKVVCGCIPRIPVGRLRMWWRKRQINKSLRVLDALDWHMRKAGWTRQQRRQFWRDFIKKQEFRTGTLNQLTQQ